MQPGFYLAVHQTGRTDQDQWTQELRLTSPADRRVSYVVGLYYFDQRIDRAFDRYIFNGWATADFDVDTTNDAAFGEATWNIKNNWRLVLGGRYTRDELEFEFERVSESVFQPDIPYFTDETDEDDLSGKVTLEWNASEDMLAYVSYVQGYKGPAFNITSGSTPENTSPVDPERSDSFEIGVKSMWLDNRLLINGALFHTRYTDFQVDATESRPLVDADGNPVDNDGNGVPDTTFSYLLTNVGEVTSQGLELDIVGPVLRPHRWIESRTLPDARAADRGYHSRTDPRPTASRPTAPSAYRRSARAPPRRRRGGRSDSGPHPPSSCS